MRPNPISAVAFGGAKGVIAGFAMLSAVIWLGFGVSQEDFGGLMLGVTPFFLAYAFVISRRELPQDQLKTWLVFGLLLRVILIFSFPLLSDDVYRFVWDGRLLVQGQNPFAQLPGWYLEEGNRVPGLDEVLFEELNSPGYFTVYPPLAQLCFALSAWLYPESIAGSVLVMKVILLAGELGTLVLIRKLLVVWMLPARHALLYWLNPLVIVEVMGNLHFEGLMVFFLLLGLWFFVRHRNALAGVAMSLAVATKLLPLLFMPLLLRRLGGKGSLVFFSSFLILSLLLFWPMGNGLLLGNFGQSLDLYFRRFEFNASVYYLVRWAGFQQVGYNLIAKFGPFLAILTAILVFALAFWEKRPDWKGLPASMLVAGCIFLAFATTIHPWYVIVPLTVSVFTPYRFPVLWSGLVFFSYVNYSYYPYWENLWVVALEYTAVGGMAIFEVYRRIPEYSPMDQA